MPSVRARSCPILPVILAAACAGGATSQGVRTTDPRAAWETAGRTVGAWDDLLDRFPRTVRWLDGGRALWFAVGDGASRRYVRIDCATGERREADTPAGIGVDGAAVRLEPQPARTRSRQRAGERVDVTFVNQLDSELVLLWVEPDGNAREYARLAPGGRSQQSTFDGHAWRLQTIAGEAVAVFRAGPDAALAVVDPAAREALGAGRGRERGRRAGGDERGAPAVFVRDGGLWRRGAGGEAVVLASGGAAGFRRDVHLAPDGAVALAFDETAVAEREVTLVESSPRDAVQPRTTTIGYRKPGDPLPVVRPRLFRLADGVELPVDPQPFADAWSVDRVHWAADGREVFVLYNRRGHQQLTIYGIDAATGSVRTVVDERSATFVDYSQKTWMQWLDDTGELLWASERSGFNHLYRIDVATGAATPITAGAWMVRSVERVDTERREIWFTALGIHPGQDPYHRHLARVRFDGSDLRVLTAADGDHTWEFAPDGAHFVARWSRVDQPTVTELRRSADGALVAELGRDDATRLLAAGFRLPERFVAKGRDGATDIHGFLIVPSDFDPARRYPVLESIYAGPHDFHVPKSFTLSLRERRFAELGFVVVKIDGMGTNWRGKAFHDVCWRNLKDAGFPDRIAWMRAAAVERPWLDLSRVGVFGGSAGGQNAMAALLWHGDFYKAAAADCGCHDNRMDKIWWNEAWMGWPVGDWYAASSNVEHAHRLQGDLFLTVGELDRNVDPASTLQVVDALIRADKDFEFLLVPGGGHGVGEATYPARRRAEFFVRALRP